MKFEYNGQNYRIVFNHGPSRRLGDHVRHPVTIINTDYSGIRVFCEKCRILIGDVAKSDRIRFTTCWIMCQTDGAVPLTRSPGWIPVTSGVGIPNEMAGDRFNRAEGRLRSLENALKPVIHRLTIDDEDEFGTNTQCYCGKWTRTSRADESSEAFISRVRLEYAAHVTARVGEDSERNKLLTREFRAAAWAAFNGRKVAEFHTGMVRRFARVAAEEIEQSQGQGGSNA